MKIKTKKQLNLPQLIEWAWDNDMRNKNFESEGGAIVYFDYDSNLTCARGFVPQDFFTIEVEEEIDENTEIDNLYKMNNYKATIKSAQSTIAQDLEISVLDPISYYIMNDDLTMTLIWRDGKLVE